MLDLLRKSEQNDVPHVYDITVPSVLRKNLGFKTKLSSFYLISNENIAGMSETPAKKDILMEISSKDSSFKGVYCSAGAELTSDIRSDLNKYCDLTASMGLVKLNGKIEKVNPVIVIKGQKEY